MSETNGRQLRTVTFRSVLWGAARLCGYQPESRDLTYERATQLTEYINERVREAVEYPVDGWPDLRRIEQRYYHQGVWVPGNYGIGSIVYHVGTGAYYQAQVETETEPGVMEVDWEVTTDFSKLIPFEQLGGTRLGTVMRVWRSDPK